MKQIVILLIIFLVIRYVRKRYLMGYVNKGGATSGGQPHGEPQADGEEMVLDPVCDSYIPLATAISVRTAGGAVYFCSEECRDKFQG